MDLEPYVCQHTFFALKPTVEIVTVNCYIRAQNSAIKSLNLLDLVLSERVFESLRQHQIQALMNADSSDFQSQHQKNRCRNVSVTFFQVRLVAESV